MRSRRLGYMAVSQWRKWLVCLSVYFFVCLSVCLSVCVSNGGSLPGLDRPGGIPIATLRQQRAPPEHAEGDTGGKSTGFPGQPAPPASALSAAAPAPPPRRPLSTPRPPPGIRPARRCAPPVPRVAETDPRTGQVGDGSKYRGSVGQPRVLTAAPDSTAPASGAQADLQSCIL